MRRCFIFLIKSPQLSRVARRNIVSIITRSSSAILIFDTAFLIATPSKNLHRRRDGLQGGGEKGLIRSRKKLQVYNEEEINPLLRPRVENYDFDLAKIERYFVISLFAFRFAFKISSKENYYFQIIFIR